MKLIPAISIMRGRVAIVQDGHYSFLVNSEGKFRTPTNILKELASPDDQVFILDIDGMERNDPNLDTVTKIAAYKDVWLYAGTPESGGMMDMFISDASKVVLGTSSLVSLDELMRAVELSENVIFSIDYDGKLLAQDRKIADMGLDGLIEAVGSHVTTAMLFDLGGIRDRKAPEPELIRKLAGAFDEFYLCGHVREVDFQWLEGAGVNGAILDFRTLGGILHDRA